jgi:hypothetical protein
MNIIQEVTTELLSNLGYVGSMCHTIGPRSHLRNEKLYLCTDIGRPLSVENWLLAQNMCTVLLRTLVLVLVGLIGGTGTRRDGTEVSFIRTKSCT